MSIALHRAAGVLSVMLFGAACAREKAPAAPPTAAATATPSTAAAAPDPIGLVPLPEDKAAGELKRYQLSMAGLRAWGTAQGAVNVATAAHPEVLQSMKLTPPRTLDEMIGMMNAQPVIRDALKRSNLSAHDYVLTMLAMNQAIEGFQRKNAGTSLPPDLPPALLQNIDLVGKNLPEIEQLLKSIQK